MQSEHKFTAVFDSDIRAFDGNPMRAETPFGSPIAVGIGDAFAREELMRDALAEARVWLVSVEKQILSYGSVTLKPMIDKIDAALSH